MMQQDHGDSMEHRSDETRIRQSLSLSDAEQKFREARLKITRKAIQKIVEKDFGPISDKETPTVGLAISGGGFRAIASSLGAMEALMEKNLFDTLMYCAGLSGSVWYMAATYTQKSFSDLDNLKRVHDWIRDQMGKGVIQSSMNSTFLGNVFVNAVHKLTNHQKMTFAGVFGQALGDVLLTEESRATTLSSLREYVEEAKVPFPIMSCAHVREHRSMEGFWEEMELSPFEVSIATHGINFPTEHVDSKWNEGKLVKHLSEPPLHYIMAVCGSAYSLMLSHLTDGNEVKDKSFLEQVAAMGKGAWGGISWVGSKIHDKISGYFSKPNPEKKLMDEETFKTFVWDSGLAAKFAEYKKMHGGEEISMRRAYEIYVGLQCYDVEWARNLIDEIVESQSPVQGYSAFYPFGRNFIVDKTGFIHNPARGLEGVQKYLMNGQPMDARKQDASDRIGETMSTRDKQIVLVDSGIGCNVPAIHLLRPDRKVDVLLVVDCETKNVDKDKVSDDNVTTLKALKQQMSDHNMKFPEIPIEDIKKNPAREFYVFEDKDDPDCPVVIWFTLFNVGFRNQDDPPASAGDYPSQKLKEFRNFDVSVEAPEYGTTALQYTQRSVDRLRELMAYNIRENTDIIEKKIGQKVSHLRQKK